PALALLVSGGHTELVNVKDFGNYEIMGRTKDDAVGEAFDKVARMLGLSYPGGPKISALAKESRDKNNISPIRFPRPMINSGDLNFSFSGLKTAVLYKLRSEKEITEDFKARVAREFEDAVTEVLVEKTREALDNLPDVKSLIVAGGVSANIYLKESFTKLLEEFPEITLYFPTKELSTDNAIMIAIAGFVRATLDPTILENKIILSANGNLSISTPPLE
ncbi:MAG: tRNA (adenosine(37)-N6)-threonylcarbamoyltransferase complex transferase subunit TsaD, partial [Patescibacteria group bacterium]